MSSATAALKAIYDSLIGAFAVELEASIRPCKQILDVGCGAHSPLFAFANRIDATGLDGYRPALDASKRLNIHSRYVQMRLQDIGNGIRDRSFECVVCCDVIEHFEKAESRAFILHLERIAAKRVILFTPNGFVPQGEIDGNPFQIHRCGWNVRELEAIGYSVTGIYGWKPLRGERADYRIRPRVLGKLLSDLTQPWVRNHPHRAFALLACKNLR